MVSASFRVHNQLRRFLLRPVQHQHPLSELGNGGISRPEPSRNISRKLRSAFNVQENLSSMSNLIRNVTGLYRSGGLLFLIFQVIHVDQVGYVRHSENFCLTYLA